MKSMEEDQELMMKHVCKFCSKSFPCGRSLGGHMRSHLISTSEPDEKGHKKKLPPLIAHHHQHQSADSAHNIAYGLRENPKKTCKIADKSRTADADTLPPSRICKECGKGFQSWKALFGHMKCHSEKLSNSLEEDSWNDNDTNKKKMVMITDSQSDNEAAAPNRKKRSSRRIKKVMLGSKSTPTLRTTVNISSSPCVSDIEQEQEEVAISLILLSRDVGSWSGLNSIGESSGNNSEFLSSSQADQISKVERNNANFEANGSLKQNLESAELVSPKTNESELKKADEISENSRSKNTEMDCGIGLQKNVIKESGKKQPQIDPRKKNSSKRKRADLHDPAISADYSNKQLSAADGEVDTAEFQEGFTKKSTFECTACNKTFHSYQALGGHRASHKRIRGCFASRIDSSENSTETEVSPNQTADSKLIKCHSSDNITENLITEKFEAADHHLGLSKKSISTTNKAHECPICFRVFPSGQALGGHKRSHLIAEAKSNQSNQSSQSIVIQKPIVQEMGRDFLDLNFPPPAEEESSNQQVGFQQWWIGSSLKQEQQQLVGLLST